MPDGLRAAAAPLDLHEFTGLVVANLINNALVHGQEGAPVRVRVHDEPTSVVIAVHNRGTPIPPDELPHLFEPMRHRAADRPRS